MKCKLVVNAITKFLVGAIMIGALLFIPAGTFYYWNGWLFMGILFVPMFFLGLILLLKAPDLLAKRLQSKEKESEQKIVILLSLFIFVGGFVLSALDFRFGWSDLPTWIVILAAVIMLGSYGLYAEVMRENAYLSRTIEVQENQKVIDTGLYGVVRHPMYFATTIMFLSCPIVLGSWIFFFIFLVYPILMVKRIKNEELVLEQGLQGYNEYKQKVKYRLIPFVW